MFGHRAGIDHAPMIERRKWWRQRWWMILGGFALSFGVGLAFANYVRSFGDWDKGQPWERALMIRAHHPLPRVVDALLSVTPWFGTNITLIPAVLLIAWWLWVRLHRRHLAVQLLVVQVGSYLLNPSLKAMFDRERPDLFVKRGWYGWSSFPSGHAIASISVLFTVAALLHRAKGWRWPYYVAVPIMFASIYSRMYLSVHWPTDIIAGVVVGLVWLAVTMYAFRETAGADEA
jgi:membrane-associated phospholipid phosphatase